jgi:hypothetical protein
VKFAGPYSHRGTTLWLAKTVVVWDEDGRTIPGDAHIGSPESQVAGLNGAGNTPDAAARDLEQKLVQMKSYETEGA